jgi:hypothetical protein
MLTGVPLATAQLGIDFDAITVLIIVIPACWAALELTAWARVDDREVAWRGLLLTHSVPLDEVADVQEAEWFLVHGTGPQLALVTKDGKRLRITPSTWVGEKARRDFESAIRTAMSRVSVDK